MRIRWLTIFLDFPAGAFGAGVAFWQQVTGSGLSAPRGPAGQFATLLPADGDACLRVQRLPGVTGRCHLDLHLDPAAGPVGAGAAEAAALGARVLHRSDGLVILASPGGFTFCLVGWHGQTSVPSPVGLAGAGESRLDQLCLDIPPAAFAAECAFWAALTGWELRRGVLPEFCYLERPAELPVRLLLQRREQAAPRDQVSAHPDFACTDPARLAERHVAAGARITGRFPHWIAMADPGGRPYCLTMRDPHTGKLAGPPPAPRG